MDEETKKRLQDAGFEETSVSDFLELSPADEVVVELRVRLAKELQKRRKAQGLTQAELAERRQTTQSRISSIENADESVSIDALIAALAELGVDRKEIGRVIAA